MRKPTKEREAEAHGLRENINFTVAVIVAISRGLYIGSGTLRQEARSVG